VGVVDLQGFPRDFRWGAATAAPQIEGGWDSDGRGPSVWDEFAAEKGKVFNGDTPAVGCDHYHLWRDDVSLMRTIGLQSYRFSVSWSRVLPEGVGQVNEAGLDFYDQLVDGLLEVGIEPAVTLFHWDFPQALEARGGWRERDSAAWFAEFAELMAGRLGDRVKTWLTFNEPQIFLGLGHAAKIHAPALGLEAAEVMQANHHVNLAHGLAVQRIRSLVDASHVGFAIATKIGIPANPNDPADVEAARRHTQEATWHDDHETWLNNGWWPDPMILGRYPEILAEKLPDFVERLDPADMAVIQQPLDFFGFNYYSGRLVTSADNAQGWEALPEPPGTPRTMFGWTIRPEGLYWASKFLHERYQLPLYVFENGLSSMDWVALDGRVHDYNRIDFLTRYLCQLRRAVVEGLPVLGYYHWSLMDNFEWASGYRERFGLIHVDFDTQKRTLKDSAYWYATVIEANGDNLPADALEAIACNKNLSKQA
jgi:beta-glucosidase